MTIDVLSGPLCKLEYGWMLVANNGTIYFEKPERETDLFKIERGKQYQCSLTQVAESPRH